MISHRRFIPGSSKTEKNRWRLRKRPWRKRRRQHRKRQECLPAVAPVVVRPAPETVAAHRKKRETRKKMRMLLFLALCLGKTQKVIPVRKRAGRLPAKQRPELQRRSRKMAVRQNPGRRQYLQKERPIRRREARVVRRHLLILPEKILLRKRRMLRLCKTPKDRDKQRQQRNPERLP